MVEECLKEVEEGGKLKEKAKKVLVHFNIATSPEEELSIIQKKLEKATPVLEAVYIYYGAGLVFHSGGPAKTAPPEAPLGRLDAEGGADGSAAEMTAAEARASNRRRHAAG